MLSDGQVGYWDRIDPVSDQFEIEAWPFFQITRLLGLYHQRLEAVLKPIDIDVPRWRVLMILNRMPVATITVIADIAVAKISTMAKIIQRMTAQGLVETRISAEDARSTEVFITDLGRSKLTSVRAKASVLSAQAFHGVSEQELKALTDVASKIHGNLSV